ncbi:MAG: aldo/keto reductase [Halofilum sp. (in: g-proteobacteria)]|nr:aldo/keto reductase [Halofilum sp. (in: g-proteobacteria)]
MRTRELGRSGLVVPEIGLGCMGLSSVYGPVDDDAALAVLHRAWELGVRLFDTADRYGAGHNERLLGRFLAGRRAQAVVATKGGLVDTQAQPDARPVRNDPEYIVRACEASLQRLGTDYIDLYYLHRIDPEVPIEDVMGAGAPGRAGQGAPCRALEVAATTLEPAAAVHPVAAVQSEYSLWTREVEPRVLPACRRLGVGLVPFSPLGRGFLGGSVRSGADLAEDDFRRGNPRFEEANLEANRGLAEAVAELAARRGATPAQVALAWVLGQGEDIVPIPGTKRVRYLEDNVAAAGIELDADERAELERLFAGDAVQGARYGEAVMRMVDRRRPTPAHRARPSRGRRRRVFEVGAAGGGRMRAGFALSGFGRHRSAVPAGTTVRPAGIPTA